MSIAAEFDAPFLSHALTVAQAAARAGGAVALRDFRGESLRVETKGDGSFVSRADRDAEECIRDALAADSALGALDVLGEEHGSTGGGSDLRWVIDPIDGTFLFVNGVPLWGTLIALQRVVDGRSLVGVVYLPAIDNCYCAARGLGATRDGRAIRANAPTAAERAIIHVPDERSFVRRGHAGELAALRAQFPRVRGFFDCFGHAMCAEGAFAASLDLEVATWDIAASSVLLEEAGGTLLVRPAAGRPERYDALLGTTAVLDRVAPLLGF